MNKDVIECKICGVGSDVMYVNPKTELCNACKNIEGEPIVMLALKDPDDVVKLHNTLEDIFG